MNKENAAQHWTPSIKPLEWDVADDEDIPDWEVADTIVGRYSIANGELFIIAPEYEELVQSSIRHDGDPKAAAQAHFNSLIIGVLNLAEGH